MGEAVRPPRSGELGEWPRRSGGGRLWALVAAAVAATLVLALVAREPAAPGEEAPEPPAQALGRWTTGDARYAERSITVTRSSVVIELGRGVPPDEGSITAVRTWREGPAEVVRLEYSTVEGEQLVEMVLAGRDRMRLRNPPEVVWSRSR